MTVENPRNIYALADVHGDFEGMRNTFDAMANDGMDLTQDLLIQLGDIIDGSHDSMACVQFLRSIQEDRPNNVVVLLGNHEDLLFQAIGKDEYQSAMRMWWYQGGEATWHSYREVGELPLWTQQYFCAKKFVPNETFMNDILWMQQLPLYYETDDLIFVHAGLRPLLPLEAQKRHDLLWIREEFHYSSYDWGKTIVYGHTAREVPLVEPNKVGLDTMWHGTGKVGGAKFTNGTLVQLYGS